MRRLAWLIVASWPLAALGQAPTPGPAPIPDTLASIEAEEESARKRFVENATKVVTTAREAAEVSAADDAYHAQIQGLMDRALNLSRLHSGESKGIPAAEWVARQTLFRQGDNIATRGDAAYRLLANSPVLDSPEIGLAIDHAKHIGPRCPAIEPFLRSVISRSRHPYLIVDARFALGHYLGQMVRMHDRLAAPLSGPELTKSLTKDRLARFRAINGPKLRIEAEALLDQVVREQGGDNPQTLGGAAAGEVYRIRHLRIGQAAPELVGEDINGAPIRLSDFRGKVVVLSLWVNMGYPYMPIDEGKDLVATMKGRPFVLVGVYDDAAEDRAKVKEAMTIEGISWQSLWAAGPQGTIPRKWGIDRWGAYGRRIVYTIDANGIIRDDQVGDKLTPAPFEPLVQAAEKAAR